ncbi:uncharacterized protein LOC117180429 [Belonocnema kinseyi]|uniref:uncharacterized protein LOC117180429 n=1 Tax=Belonocnema kinseyi TaxID=2817044 RepID=UPI00143CE5D5|nr:uncharacterized protein LOC117180429 [Belonocnema kinseyi]
MVTHYIQFSDGKDRDLSSRSRSQIEATPADSIDEKEIKPNPNTENSPTESVIDVESHVKDAEVKNQRLRLPSRKLYESQDTDIVEKAEETTDDKKRKVPFYATFFNFYYYWGI